MSYRRYLVLFAVGELGETTQRALAAWLGVTEPSVSRMIRTLVEDGWLRVEPDRAGGNRRCVTLSLNGKQLVRRCGLLLERRFAGLVGEAGLSYDEYRDATAALLTALRADHGPPTSTRPSSKHESSPEK